jgi:uncharacterized ferritin-like protein (DUF455 family)
MTESLREAAARCLACAEPAGKAALTREAWAALQEGRLDVAADSPAPVLPAVGRPERPRLVPPSRLPRRGLGSRQGRAAFVHAIAHIEFNAINLAWDAVARFDAMPPDFYRDWAAVAADEARHFELLTAHLGRLDAAYGDFDAHDGLWQAAMDTADDCLRRMALVPRVLEARGLDVAPEMIERLQAAGDEAGADILRLILREEVAHVATGTRWFRHLCTERGLDADSTFLELVARHMPGAGKGRLHVEARLAAGFSEVELAALGAVGRPH